MAGCPSLSPTLVAGYRQWQGLWRQVMKGQPGYMIFAPVTGRFASSNPADPNSSRRLGPREKHKVNEIVRSRMVGARPAYVWDASQTDGEPLPMPPSSSPHSKPPARPSSSLASRLPHSPSPRSRSAVGSEFSLRG